MSESSTTQLRYHAARILRKVANRISPKGATGAVDFPDIGARHLPKNAPRALVIYIAAGIERYMRNAFNEHDPFFNKHTMYWESVEMVRQLNAHGYVVDYADFRNPFTGDWSKYSVVFDVLDNLRNAPERPDLRRVNYTTYIHWLSWNRAELNRISWFKDRTGIVIPYTRSLPPIMSDEHADYLTYFGTQLQASSFSARPIKYQLDISAVHIPEYRPKNIGESRKNFLWLGGGGMVHKGLDIAMEAFAKLPNLHLYIAGNLQSEPRFWQWAGPFLVKHPNIHALGWMDVGGAEFDTVGRTCIGIVYPSGAEGGPGSVAQALHWGLIPIVTKSALVRAEILGHIIQGNTDTQLITSTVGCVQRVADTPEAELSGSSKAVIDFAREHHTRSAYSKSFEKFLTGIV